MSNNYQPVTHQTRNRKYFTFYSLTSTDSEEQLGKMYNFPSPDGHNKEDNCNTLLK